MRESFLCGCVRDGDAVTLCAEHFLPVPYNHYGFVAIGGEIVSAVSAASSVSITVVCDPQG